MFKKLTQNLKDMGTIKQLSEAAERIANEEHQAAPGAEHFALAALQLPDGSAARILQKLGVSPDALRQAIREQERQSLRAIGVAEEQIATSETDVPPVPEPRGPYTAQPSGQAMMQGLAALRQRGVAGPLIGAHVFQVVWTMRHGPLVRAFRLLGRDEATVMAAVQSEMVLAA